MSRIHVCGCHFLIVDGSIIFISVDDNTYSVVLVNIMSTFEKGKQYIEGRTAQIALFGRFPFTALLYFSFRDKDTISGATATENTISVGGLSISVTLVCYF